MRRIVFIAVLFALVSSPVMADFIGTIDVKYISTIPGMQVGIFSTNAVYSGKTVTAGIYNIQVSNSTYTPDTYLGDGSSTPYSIEAFCVDIFDAVNFSWEPYDIKTVPQVPDLSAAPLGGMGTAKAGYVARLLDTYWVSGMTNVQGAALQVALWEILDEALPANPTPVPPVTGWDVSFLSANRGTFFLSGTSDTNVRDLANSMLSTVAQLGVAPYSNYVGLTHPQVGNPKPTEYQDYIVRVPIPGAVLLGVLGLGIVGWKLRKYA